MRKYLHKNWPKFFGQFWGNRGKNFRTSENFLALTPMHPACFDLKEKNDIFIYKSLPCEVNVKC